MPILPGLLLHEARSRAGLSQRALADRAETAQSVIARIEGGQTSPSVNTLARLLGAAGFDVSMEMTIRPAAASHMLDDVARIRALTPEDRLNELANFSRFVAAARRV